MQTNINGMFISYNKDTKFVVISHGEGAKIPNFKWEKNITAKLDPTFVGFRNGQPSTIFGFKEGDHVQVHVRMIKYYLREEDREGYRLLITKLTLI